MTNYTDKEFSVAAGSPFEAYKFTGQLGNYHYTSAETDITVNGQLYTHVPVVRNAISVTGHQEDNPDLELEVPYDLELVQDYAYQIPPTSLTLEILRYHEGTDPGTDYIIVWKGVVGPITIAGHKAKIVVPNVFAMALRGEIPSVWYHQPCNHVLYDARCVVDPATHHHDTQVASLTSDDIIVVDDDGYADHYLRGGEAVLTNERRLIVDNVANVITLNYPFRTIAVDDAIILYIGCDHSFTMCKARFSNGPNYGGFPFIPKDNPFETEL